jgi:hypothetical protein
VTRIGELLVAGGLTTAESIDRALESQALHGGRLGTSLVEMEAVSLDALSESLAHQHELPAALQRHFQDADPDIQSRLDPALAAKWRAVPLGRLPGSEERIAVAVMDPLPPQGIGELAEALGVMVVTAVAAELRIRYQLERIYGVERPNRFKRAVADPEQAAHERRGSIRTLSDLAVDEATSALARIAVRRIQVPVTGRMPAIEPDADLSTMEGAMRAIRRAGSRARVGELTISALEGGWDGALSAGVLMNIRANCLFGWRGFVRGSVPETMEDVAVPLDAPSLFSDPCRTTTSFFGRSRRPTDLDERFWSVLAAGRVGEFGVHPVSVFGRVACVLYVQTAGVMPPEVATGVTEIGQSLCIALERLVKADRR